MSIDKIQDSLYLAAKLIEEQAGSIAKMKKKLGKEFIRQTDVEQLWNSQGVIKELTKHGIEAKLYFQSAGVRGIVITEPIAIDDHKFTVLSEIRIRFGASIQITDSRVWIRPMY